MLHSHRSLRGLAFLALATLLPSLAFSDDLAALARKEKERRAKISKPTKVLTEDDGKEAATKGAGSVTALSGEASSGAAAAAPSASDSRDAEKAAWKTRSDSVRAAVANAEKRLAEMEQELATYRSDMTVLSGADAQDPMRLQKREARMVEMNKQIEAQKAAVVETKKALAAFEAEARKSGVPAGWLR